MLHDSRPLAAAVLFVSPLPSDRLPHEAERLGEVVRRTVAQMTPDQVWAELAYAYGDHPETAATRMTACLRAVETQLSEVTR